MKRGITINLNNKTFYTLLVILSILVVSGIAYAALNPAVPNPGHAIEDLETCAAGQTLVMAGGAWTCGSAASGSLTCQNVNGANTNGNALCTALGSGWKCTSTGNDMNNCETTFGSLVARCCKIQ